MRFHIGRVPEDESFQPERDGWTRLREPSLGQVYLYAVPVMAATSVVLLAAIPSDPTARIVLRASEVTAPRIALFICYAVGSFFGPLFAHELIHLLSFPGHGFSCDAVLGIWPSRLIAYANFEGPISRNRLLFSLATPFLLLSVVPISWFWISGRVSLPIAAGALLNGIGSSFDLFYIGLVLLRVPENVVLRNKGIATYWKPASEV